MVSSNSNTGAPEFGDTTHTKIFVGGLPWETQRETMKHYFQQFGEILEAVVITDKITGRSKGYGFVTFKDPESAARACENPNPIIDGRRANCNLAVLGAQKNRPTTPQPQREAEGMKKSRASSTRPFTGTPTYFYHYNPQYALIPYYSAAYGYQYPLYQQANFTVNYPYPGYHNGYGGGQGSANPGLYYSSSNYYPLYLYPIPPSQPQRGESNPTTSNPKIAEPLAGKCQQLSPRVHRLMYATQQVPCEITNLE